jgi:hypothetical protein
VTNKYFSNPYLINAAKNAIELLESKEDVWCRNGVIENKMSEIVGELRNAVIETDTEKSVEKMETQAKIDKQYWDRQVKR